MSNRDFPTSTFIFCFRIEFFFKYLEEYLIRGNDSRQIGIKQRRINTFSATWEGRKRIRINLYIAYYFRVRFLFALIRATWKTFTQHYSPAGVKKSSISKSLCNICLQPLRTNPIGRRVQSNRAKGKEPRVSSGRGSWFLVIPPRWYAIDLGRVVGKLCSGVAWFNERYLPRYLHDLFSKTSKIEREWKTLGRYLQGVNCDPLEQETLIHINLFILLYIRIFHCFFSSSINTLRLLFPYYYYCI